MNRIWFESWQRVGLAIARAAMLLALLGAPIGQLGWAQTNGGPLAQPRGSAPQQPDCSQAQAKYLGPLSTETRLVRDDPFVWFVTPEFAARFCMPAVFTEPQLQGALAIAAGMVPYWPTKKCQRISASEVQCTTGLHLMLDIYIDNKSVKLPKSDPTVELYVPRVDTSADAIGFGTWRVDQLYKGIDSWVKGERPAYGPHGVRRQPDSVIFNLLGVRGNWASTGGELVEMYYRANWMPGIDLLRLSLGDRYGGMENPATKEVHPRDSEKDQPIQRWAIGAILEKDQPQQGGFDPNNWKIIPYPSGYLHTIELPLNLAQIIYEYDKKSGTAFFDEMQQRFERATGSTAPVFRPPASK